MSPARRHHQSSISKLLNSIASDLGLVIAVVIIMIAVYLIDTVTPLGQPVWLLYFIPLILSYWSDRVYAIPVVCAVTLFFLICGFLVSPEGIAVTMAILNRFIFFLVFISLSLILWAIRKEDRKSVV